MSTGYFFVTPFNYSAGYRISGGRISGQFSIRCNPKQNSNVIMQIQRQRVLGKLEDGQDG